MSVNNSKRVENLLSNKTYIVMENLIFNKKGNLIKGSKMKSGYVKTVLTDKKGEFNATLHQIIWVSKNGSYDSKFEINHKDGNKQNNSLSNLELVTRSENIKHAFRMGLRKHGGTSWWGSKFTSDTLKELFRLRKQGWSQKELANKFNIDQGAISKTLAGKYYKEEVLLCQ